MADRKDPKMTGDALEALLLARTSELSALERTAHVLEAMLHSPTAESSARRRELFQTLNQQAADLLHVDKCAILLYDADKEALVGQVPGLGISDEVMQGYRIPVGSGSPAQPLWSEGRTVILNDVPTEPIVRLVGLDRLAEQVGIRSTLLTVLRHEGTPLGVLQLSNKCDGTGFTADDARLVSILAGQLALALKYARLLEESQRQAGEVALLYDLAATLARAVDLDDTLQTVFTQLRRMLDYDLCFVSLATPDGQRLQVRAADAEAEGLDKLLGLEMPIEQGINGWMYREGRPILVDDADQDPRRLHIEGRTEWIRSAVGAPLIASGQPIGTIYATRRQSRAFSQAHLDLMTMTAAQVAAAVQRARLLDQARRRAEEMETLSRIGAVMASSLDPDVILQAIYEQAGRIMDTSAFFVALYEAETSTLSFRLVYDEGQRLESFSVVLSQRPGLAGHVALSGRPLLVRNLDEERGVLPELPVVLGREPSSWLGVPIIAQDQVLGVISAQSYEPYAFTGDQMSMLLAIANQAGIALQNTRLYSAAKDALQAAAEERDKLALLHRMVAAMQRADTLLEKLQIIADAIHAIGWGRVTVTTRDADLNATGLVCAGLTPEDEAQLRAHMQPGSAWKAWFGQEFERFRIGHCYYLPFSDPWVRETLQGVRSHKEAAPGDTWHPRDLLYVVLHGREERMVGIIGLDDPVDARRPTRESLAIIELFAQEAALTIENAELLGNLKLLNADLQDMLAAQAQLLQTVEELASPVVPVVEGVIVLPLIGHIDDRRAGQILETLLSGVEQYKARVAILDITGVAVVDTAVAHHLMHAVRAARLLGAEAILVGIRPDVAQALTTSGVALRDVVTRSNLMSGFQYALSLIGQSIVSRK